MQLSEPIMATCALGGLKYETHGAMELFFEIRSVKISDLAAVRDR
jgi:hypothetical protein